MLYLAIVSIYALNAIWVTCQAVPLMDLKNVLGQNVLDTMVTSECSSNGECWEWLPVQVHENIVTIPQSLPISGSQFRRQAPNIDPNTITESWDNNGGTLGNKNQLSMDSKQIKNRLSKKDVLMSRSWGAGGMPFSVLYMNPHNFRGNHASTEQQRGTQKILDNPVPPMTQSNYRIAVRNGSPTLPRKYSIIPQLYISYGWGQFDK